MLPLALAIAPGIAIALFIYLQDSYNPEPASLLLGSFFFGMVSTLPAIGLQLLAKKYYGALDSNSSIPFYAFYSFIIIGCSEEFSKFLMVKWYAYPKKSFDEPFDGIVYSVMVAMGFATVENIGYVKMNGLDTAILRMFISVPAHGAYAVILGYYIGLAKFNKVHARVYLISGILIAAFFHGCFDFFLLLQDSRIVAAYVGHGLLFTGAIVSFYYALRLSLKAIRLHRELSRIDFENRQKR